jgi:hypothetical protein
MDDLMSQEEDRFPGWVRVLLLLLLSLAGWWGLISLVACTSSPSGPAPAAEPTEVEQRLAAAKPRTMEQVLRPPLIGSLAAMLSVPVEHGYARLLHGRTACRPLDGRPNPYIVLPHAVPAVGRPFSVLFVSSACPLPAEPDVPLWILTSYREPAAPIDFGRFGMPGCWLLINMDQVTAVPVGFEAPAGALLHRERGAGRVTLNWTPAPGMAGLTVWFQLLAAAPGASPSGFLASPGLELHVGS